jgi:hypothetical protein
MGRLVLMGCGALFALLVIVVLALTFGPPTFLGSWQETPIEQPTTTQQPSPPPDETTEQKKEEDTSQTVTIRVTGTPGVAFSGGYATAGGTYSSIEGVTSQDFEVPVRTEADGVAANVQKRDEGNEELTLQLLVGGEVVAQQSTTEPFGGVSV